MEDGFPRLKNDLILKAANGLKTDRVPVWIMRQAGRHLPEFLEIRKDHDFFKVCYTPELACKVTLQPLKRYKLDAAIIFSDILVIPQALGMDVQMKPGVGPFFPNPLTDPKDIQYLRPTNIPDTLDKVYEAITLTRHQLKGQVPLIGFSGAPWTLMCYMIEGGGSKTMSKAKRWLYQWPEESHELLDLLTNIIIEYLVKQVRAGAQLLQIFDVNAGYLTQEHFKIFSLPYLEKISTKVKAALKQEELKAPLIVFAKDVHYAIDDLASIGYDVISLDWTISPSEARKKSKGLCLQGNLDPCALYASLEDIEIHVKQMIDDFGTQGYIANLGHGIYPDMEPTHVNAFIEAVYKFSSH